MVEVLLIVGGIVAVLVAMVMTAAYLMRHPEQRGASTAGSGRMTAGFDEVFNPHAAAARHDVDRESRLVVPAPTPDGDRGIADGRIRLDL